MASEPSLQDRAKAAFWPPCTHLTDRDLWPPVEILGAGGSHLHLADGRRVLDGISSWWCKALGHRHPDLLAALTEQAGRFDHVIAAGTVNEPLVRLCERLVAVVGGRAATVFLAGDGSTGMEIALKMALQFQAQTGHPGRTHIACLENAYHGETVATLAVSDCALYRAPFAAWCFPGTVLTGAPYRSGPTDPAWLDAGREWPGIRAQLDAVAGELAAVVVEPVLQGAGGMRVYSPDLLTRLRAWCDAHGVLLIADEIAAGMGRCGAWLGSQLAPNAGADLTVLSKGLTGGMLPLAATVVSRRVQEAFAGTWDSGRSFLHSNTYCGHALAVAVAHAALDALAPLLPDIQRRGEGLRARLAEVARTTGALGSVRGVGFVAAADLLAPDAIPSRLGQRICRAALAHGAFLRPLGSTLYLLPPLNASDAELDALAESLGRAVADVARSAERQLGIGGAPSDD